jgi:hypothetical protein
MKPTEKSPEIDALLKSSFGINRRKSILNNRCVFCGKQATEFTDEISKREFSISGICQKCQDETFGDL